MALKVETYDMNEMQCIYVCMYMYMYVYVFIYIEDEDEESARKERQKEEKICGKYRTIDEDV